MRGFKSPLFTKVLKESLFIGGLEFCFWL
ncbi:hypothetical protein FA048_12700 [Pedobacter polaris]|uniref:Uncharacterized protein n=1 Tax=Pedobacter polaris TaxID=2571273 RepID=A0A4U1CMR9_9SPHI|nr:hypothetical protein FA048_12700 [Pedobacter polaris]